MDALRIGGLTPFTLVDFPGKLAAVVFCQGCPWRCSYCHNPHLLPAVGKTHANRTWESVLDLLQRRRGLLDGVVFSGGEPTLQRGLLEAVRQVKSMGFNAALHTSGAYPNRLEALLPDLDWVGFDVKTSFADYDVVTGGKNSGARVARSLDFLLQSGVEYEVRTTVHQALTDNRLLTLCQRLAESGVRRYAVQECRPLAGTYGLLRAPIANELLQDLRGLFDTFVVRWAGATPVS